MIPLFQRTYVWEEEQWDRLWRDILELLNPGQEGKRHFIGSIVCVPEKHQPGVVPGYEIIDGQQRLMTLSIILCALRDFASEHGWTELSGEIHDNYLVHRYKKDRERYKIYPRLRDRQAYLKLVDGQASDLPDSRIKSAYWFFRKHLDDDGIGSEEGIRSFFDTLADRLDLVAITLGDENPYLIFKSLNSTGLDLGEHDLIRNHVFMRVKVEEQDSFDGTEWGPLEERFASNGVVDGKELVSFFRRALMRCGDYVKEDCVFEAFEHKHPVKTLDPIVVAREYRALVDLYDVIVGKSVQVDPRLVKALAALRDVEATTAYPLVLLLMEMQRDGKIRIDELVDAVNSVTSFVLRRYICGESSRGYARWFCHACDDVRKEGLSGLYAFLNRQGWPDDERFQESFRIFNLYESKYGAEVIKGIELAIQKSSEPVGLDACELEHIMPQSIGDDDDGKCWKSELGPEWEKVHAKWLHTPGNITLVGSDYNRSMRNRAFLVKKATLAASKVYLNRYFSDASLTKWDESAVIARGEMLARTASKVWVSPHEAPPSSQ